MRKGIAIVLVLMMILPFTLISCGGGSGGAASGGGGSSSSSGGSSSASTSSASNQAPIRLGGVWGLTGSTQLTGFFLGGAAQMAIDRINAEGGLLGRQVELIVEDEMEDQQQSVTAVTKLLARGDIPAFYQGLKSPHALAASTVVRQNEVVHMAGGSSANIWRENNPWVWQVRVTDEKSGPIVANALIDNLGAKKPAIIFVNDAFGSGYADAIVPALEARGITPTMVAGYPDGELQFGPLITQVMAAGSDALFAASHGADAAQIMKEIKSQGKGIPLLGSSSYSSKDTIDLAGDDSLGAYSLSDWSVTVNTPEAQAFTKEFIERYGEEPQWSSATCYDAFMLVAEAIKITGSAEPEKIREGLGLIKAYQGVTCLLEANENRSFACQQYLCQIKKVDGGINKSVVVDTVSSR